MKKIKKALVMVSLVSSFAFSTTLISMAGQWEQQTDGNWKYKNDDGSFATGKITIDGVEYFFNDLGDLVSETTGWSNEKEAKAIGKEIQEQLGSSINPVQIYTSSSAGFGTSSATVFEISKNGNGYDLTLRARINSSESKKGLQAICMLTGINGLYDTIYDSYEGSNSNGINYDEFVKVGNYQIKATLGQNGNSMIYTIIEK